MAHPLAHGLYVFWPCCEGTGMCLGDISRSARHLRDMAGLPAWKPGKFGHAIEMPSGSNAYFYREGNCPQSTPLTIACWVMTTDDTASQCAIWAGDHSSTDDYWALCLDGTDNDRVKAIARNTATRYAYASRPFVAHSWHHIAAVFVSPTQRHAYIDGGNKGTNTESREPDVVGTPAVSLGGLYDATPSQHLSGRIAMGGIWTRALSDNEIRQLHRDPFAMFERRTAPALFFAWIDQVVDLEGTLTAQAGASGAIRAGRSISGESVCSTTLSGSLSFVSQVALAGTARAVSGLSAIARATFSGVWFKGSLQLDRNWLLGALFGGMTAEAFKLRTVLSTGWFWMRCKGCTALYRGANTEQIDFTNTLALAESDASELSPPTYLDHHSGSTYFYVVRRFNEWGHQESTLSAAVKVAIGSSGELAEPQPNDIFASAIGQIDGETVELVWFYCPLQQQSEPARFNIYYDGGTGQVDYQNTIATIYYNGPMFYTCKSRQLDANRYVFAIRVEDASGIENQSLALLKVDLAVTSPSQIEILSAEAM